MLTFVMLLIGSKVQIFFEPETVWKDIFQHLSHPFATQYRLLLKCFLAARSKKYYSFFTRSAKFSCEIQILHQYDSFESHKVSFSSSQGAQSQKWNDLQHNNYIKLHAMPQTHCGSQSFHKLKIFTNKFSNIFCLGFPRRKQYTSLLREISSTSFIYELQLLRTAFKRYQRVDFKFSLVPKKVPSVISFPILKFCEIPNFDFEIQSL